VAVHTFWSSGVPCAQKNCSPLWIQVMGSSEPSYLGKQSLWTGGAGALSPPEYDHDSKRPCFSRSWVCTFLMEVDKRA